MAIYIQLKKRNGSKLKIEVAITRSGHLEILTCNQMECLQHEKPQFSANYFMYFDISINAVQRGLNRLSALDTVALRRFKSTKTSSKILYNHEQSHRIISKAHQKQKTEIAQEENKT